MAKRVSGRRKAVGGKKGGKGGGKSKYVYLFNEGRAEMKNLLGGKGANLAEMTRLGIPVPPGYTLTTEICTYYYKNRQTYPPGLKKEVEKGVAYIEGIMGTRFGDAEDPLLLSVRSGARTSMPGMMDTVLNLGLNDATVEAVARLTDNSRFAWDCYRRFVQMYGDVVLGLKPTSKSEEDPFEVVIERKKKEKGIKLDTELSTNDLKELVKEFKDLVKRRTGKTFPDDPWEQLWGSIGAVFGSWENERARTYRKLNKIPDDWGTAVNVQAMVFGNMGYDSATGVAFTRDPATGEKVFFGEYLLNAQGEDVVAGTRTPQPLNESTRTSPEQQTLEATFPELYGQLDTIQRALERHYKDMQDIEFTIQQGKLWMLQTRTGKRTGFAAIRIAVDMVEERLITPDMALLRVDPEQLNQLLRPIFDPRQKKEALDKGRLIAKGLNAGPGAATGRAVFSAEDAVQWAAKGEPIVLIRIETSPEDIGGMAVSEGFLTARGGRTSHAALVARQMGKVCVAGCGALVIDYSKGKMRVGGLEVKEGDWVSIDGYTGEVIAGKVETRPSEVMQVLIEKSLDPEDSEVFKWYDKLMGWADKARRLGVRANADQPDQATNALAFGAEGIGLCRTEHMFFGGDRIDAMREMILADTKEGREKALGKIEPMQREDFIGIFEVMGGRPVIIRTLDPPLHEFLPHEDRAIKELATDMGVDFDKVKERVESLKEANPMLGHRGCRLGISYPEITAMQAKAIIEAACICKKKGLKVLPEIMIPLVGHVKELEDQTKVVREVAERVMREQGVKVRYLVGTMIEIPRGAITADKVAEVAEFFSYGTNDLTQTCFGLSRDDGVKFIPEYLSRGILEVEPFQSIDPDGVGYLMRIGNARGRMGRPGIELGICGEHGGDPASVEFCHEIGLDYVSCSPYRLPLARLAAAQAALKEKMFERMVAEKSRRAKGGKVKKGAKRRPAKKGKKDTRRRPRKKGKGRGRR
jgi:pyruvate,orthophosphate dikinase